MAPKKEIKTEPEKKWCGGCSSNKRLTEFYYSSTYSNRATKTVSICKKCITDYVKPEYKNLYDVQKIKDILRMIDKPFLQRIWDSSKEECDKREGDRDYFGAYMKNIAMAHFKDYTWKESEFANHEVKINNDKVALSDTNALVDDEEFEDVTEEDLKAWKKQWGEGTIQDYLFMSEFYGEYTSKFPTDTPAQVNIYKNLAKIHLNAEKALQAGNIKDFKDLMDLSSKMHNDAKIKPIQSTGAGEDKGLTNYGLWIKDIEDYEPCEYFKDKPLYDDYDGIQGYFEKWILRPMRNTFGKKRDFDVGED